MLKGLRRADLALGGLATALVLVVLALGAFAYSEQDRQQRREREQAAQHETNDSEQQWEAVCTEITRACTTTCIIQPPHTEAETQRAERDLRAQEQMASWALLMFFATVIGVITTIIGLIYVVRAYFINAQATRHASEAAKAATAANQQTRAQFIAQQRPWLSCDVRDVRAHTSKKDVTLMMEFVLTNHGQSPATAVEICINKIGPYDDEHKSLFKHMTVVERQRGTEDGDVVFPSEAAPLKLTRGFGVPYDAPAQITGWIRYRFEGATRYHLTPFRLVIGMRVKMFDDGPRIDNVTVNQDTTGIAPD